jgi:S1-C subfamily serine protease
LLKISIRNRYPIVMLCVAVVILVLGIIFKPKKTTARQLSESDIALTSSRAEQNRLRDLSKFLSDAADDSSHRLLYLKSTPHTAVFWERDQAVAARDPASPPPAARVSLDGASADLKKVPSPVAAPFDVFSVPAELGRAKPWITPTIATGDWVIAVARKSADQVLFSHGLYQGMSRAHCGDFEYEQVDSSSAISDVLLGGGLFTLNGALIGFITACNGAPIVISAASVTSALHQPVPLADRLRHEVGLGVGAVYSPAIGAAETRVTMVWAGGPSDQAGIRAGDVLLEVDGLPVHSVPDLEPLGSLDTQTAHAVLLQRGREKVRVTLSSGSGASGAGAEKGIAAISGLVLATDPIAGRVLVTAIEPDSAAAQAGIRAGDVIAQVRGVTVDSSEQALKLSRAPQKGTLRLTIERGTKRAEVAVPDE